MIGTSTVLKKAILGLLLVLCSTTWHIVEVTSDGTDSNNAATKQPEFALEAEGTVKVLPPGEPFAEEKLIINGEENIKDLPSQVEVEPEISISEVISGNVITEDPSKGKESQTSSSTDQSQIVSPDDDLLKNKLEVHIAENKQETNGFIDKLSNDTLENATKEEQVAKDSEKIVDENVTLIEKTEEKEDIAKQSVQETAVPGGDASGSFEGPVEITVSDEALPPFKEDSPAMKSSIEPVEDMPSFDEWKKKMLAEQEKSKQNDLIGHSIPPAPSKMKQQSKNRNNYASIDCGAKIVAINSEAQSASSILIENRDEYMLNPCRAKIWFVVELCEPIQLKVFEIANFELFSSTPQTFRAYSSDRYPTRDWTLVGTFNARDERAVQQFPLNGQNFVKYFKLEMLSHFGSEHYCPLSLLRVYGTSMVEEYEDSQSDHPAPDVYIEDLDADLEKDANEVPKNLFGSAKDAVISIVKKAAIALTGEKQDGTLKQNETSNVTTEESEKNNVSEESKEKSESVCEQPSNPESTLYYPHTTKAAIPTCQPGAGTQSDDKNLSSSISNMMYKSTRSLLDDCLLCDPVQNVTANHTVYDLWSTCTYMKTLLSITINTSNCCPSGKSYSRRYYPMDSVCPARVAESPCSFDVSPTVMPNLDNSEVQNSGFGQFMTSSASINENIPVDIKTIDVSRIKTSCDESLSASALSIQGLQSESNAIEPTATLKEITVEVDAKEGVKPLELEETSNGIHEVVVGTVEERSASIEEVSNTLLVADTISSPVSVTFDKKSAEEVSLVPDVDEQHANLSGSLVNISAALPAETNQIDTSSEGDMLSISTMTGDGRVTFGTPAFISSSQKESVFMRLNNRIKALELNMSLSGQYLEELSRRYRKQMEEMQRAFNKTIGALNDTAKKAHEMDLKQQEVIAVLEAQIENLTNAVDFLTQEQQGLHRKVMEHHIFLMMIEIIAMVILVVYCLWYNTSCGNNFKRLKLSQMSQNAKSRKAVKRRNSSDGTIGHSDPKNISLKRRMSDDSFIGGSNNELMIVKPSIPILIEVPAKASDGKRKKNRNKVRHKAKSAINLQEKLLDPDSETKVTSAGLLFGTSKLENSKTDSSRNLVSSSTLSYTWPLSYSNCTLSNKSLCNSSPIESTSSSLSSKSNSRSSLDSRESGSKVKVGKSVINGSCNGHAGSMTQTKKEKK